MRTLQPSLSPLPNSTSSGTAGTAFASLFYDGVEQFFCRADSCTQALNNGSSNWQCSNLACKCRPGTSFCGAVSVSDLSAVINGLGGSLGIDCGAVDSSNHTAICNFKQATLQGLFGAEGLTLNGCTFGECIRQNVIDGGGGDTAAAPTVATKSLSGGVIAGLAVVGGLLLLSLTLLGIGLRRQRIARKNQVDYERTRVSLKWSSLTYTIAAAGKKRGSLGAFRSSGNAEDDKVILDAVSGTVRPGQMMAILGPSGLCSFPCSMTDEQLIVFPRCGQDDSRGDTCCEAQVWHHIW